MPAALVAGFRANRAGVEVVAAFAQSIGMSISGSVFLAPLGIPLAALGFVMQTLAHDCDMGATFQAEARAASLGAKIGSIAAALGAVVATAGALPTAGASLAAAVPLGSIAGLLAILAPILDALGAGRAPRASDMNGAITMIAGLAGVQVDTRALTAPVDQAMAQLANNADIKRFVASAQTLAAGIPKVPSSRQLQQDAAAVKKTALKTISSTVKAVRDNPSVNVSAAVSSARATARENAVAAASAASRAKSDACAARGGVFDASAPGGCRVGSDAPKKKSSTGGTVAKVAVAAVVLKLLAGALA